MADHPLEAVNMSPDTYHDAQFPDFTLPASYREREVVLARRHVTDLLASEPMGVARMRDLTLHSYATLERALYEMAREKRVRWLGQQWRLVN